jgi:AraC-like DNA-binding protein
LRDRVLVDKAIRYIREHHAEPLSRAAIARHVGLSERALDRCFRAVAGTAPIQYLNAYRIDRAKVLLDETEKRVIDIALEVGFSQGSYFANVFRRHTGRRPGEYRKRSDREPETP